MRHFGYKDVGWSAGPGGMAESSFLAGSCFPCAGTFEFFYFARDGFVLLLAISFLLTSRSMLALSDIEIAVSGDQRSKPYHSLESYIHMSITNRRVHQCDTQPDRGCVKVNRSRKHSYSKDLLSRCLVKDTTNSIQTTLSDAHITQQPTPTHPASQTPKTDAQSRPTNLHS